MEAIDFWLEKHSFWIEKKIDEFQQEAPVKPRSEEPPVRKQFEIKWASLNDQEVLDHINSPTTNYVNKTSGILELRHKRNRPILKTFGNKWVFESTMAEQEVKE